MFVLDRKSIYKYMQVSSFTFVLLVSKKNRARPPYEIIVLPFHILFIFQTRIRKCYCGTAVVKLTSNKSSGISPLSIIVLYNTGNDEKINSSSFVDKDLLQV